MAVNTDFQFKRDRDGRVGGNVIRPSNHVDAYVLVASTAQSVSAPTNSKIALFSCNNDFYVNFSGATAIVPSTNITNGASPELNPATREIEGIGGFSIIAPNDSILTISYFK